jgi:hypothetical protein
VTRLVLAAQGAYFILTGVWPLVSMSTFEVVTGPKTDDWLVHTVGALAAAIGIALLAGVRRRDPRRESIVLAAAAAIAFAAIDIVYVANGTIRAIYLADAAVEVLFLVGLAIGRAASRAPGRGRT